MDHSAELAIRPEPVETTPPAERLISAGAEDTLERFGEPALLAAGKVNLISLEAVEKRFASRWELSRNQVYDFATRVLDRGVGVTGFFVRVSRQSISRESIWRRPCGVSTACRAIAPESGNSA